MNIIDAQTSFEGALNHVKSYGDQAEYELNKHVIGGHFKPGTLNRVGVPDIDIRIYAALGKFPDEVVSYIFTQLYRSPNDIQEYISGWAAPKEDCALTRTGLDYGVFSYLYFLIQTLKDIEYRGAGFINWRVVNQTYPKILAMPLNLEKDSFDPFFVN